MVGLLLGLVAGCQSYHAMPLSQQVVRERLAPISLSILCVHASAIRHPLLPAMKFNPNDGLTPEEAALVAVVANPELRAERDQRGIASAQLLQAGLLPNPQLTASVDVPHGADPADSFTAYDVGLNWDITSLISHDQKKQAARAQAASVDLDIAWAEWQVAETAKTAEYDVLSLTQQLENAKKIDAQFSNNLSVIQQAVNQHQRTLLDLSAAQVASQDAHAVTLSTERDLSHARLLLNHALGLTPTTKIPLSDTALPARLEPPSSAQLLTGLEDRRLDMLALKKGYASEDATLRVAILEQFPKINLGFDVARDTTNVNTVGVGIAIDIPIFDRNQGAIALEKATRQKLFDEYVSRVFDARSDIATASADIRSLNTQIAAANSTIPQVRQLVQTYQSALQQGNADILSFYNAQSELEQQEINVQKLKQELVENWIALEIASGEYLGVGTHTGKNDK
ncbi:MAG TPA: TolC family protein [Tepidisphaeraceae bacterium]